MIYLYLCLIVADTLYHPIVYLMYTHVLKWGMTLLLSICHSLPCLIFLNMLYLSEFSLNLVVFTISDQIPSYISRYSSCSFCGMLPKSNCVNSFSPFVSELFLYLFMALMLKLWFIMCCLSCCM